MADIQAYLRAKLFLGSYPRLTRHAYSFLGHLVGST